MCILDNLN